MIPSLRKLACRASFEAARDAAGVGRDLTRVHQRCLHALLGVPKSSESSQGACFRTSSTPALPSSPANLEPVLWPQQDGKGRLGLTRMWGASTPSLSRPFGALVASVYEDPPGEEEGDNATSSSDPSLDRKEDIQTIPAQLKLQTGKIAAKKDLRAMRVPGVVYSLKDGHLGGNKVCITVAQRDINRLLRRYGHSFVLSRPFTLELTSEVDGIQTVTREAVLPRSIHYAAARDDVINVTFIRLLPGERIKVDVPLVYMGEDGSPGIRRGGSLNTIKRTVKFLCPTDKIPPQIEVDLSKLDMGDKVLIGDLQVDPELALVKQSPLWPVCKIMGNKTQ